MFMRAMALVLVSAVPALAADPERAALFVAGTGALCADQLHDPGMRAEFDWYAVRILVDAGWSANRAVARVGDMTEAAGAATDVPDPAGCRMAAAIIRKTHGARAPAD